MSRGILACHHFGGSATGIWWVEARDAGRSPLHRRASPKCHGAKAEKLTPILASCVFLQPGPCGDKGMAFLPPQVSWVGS